MEETIKFGEYSIIVRGLYPYQYDYGNGTVVLRFYIDDLDGTLSYNDTIVPLMKNKENIEYYVDGVHKTTYEYFTDTNGFKAIYNNKCWEIELCQQNKISRDIEYLKNAVFDLACTTLNSDEIIDIVKEADKL